MPPFLKFLKGYTKAETEMSAWLSSGVQIPTEIELQRAFQSYANTSNHQFTNLHRLIFQHLSSPQNISKLLRGVSLMIYTLRSLAPLRDQGLCLGWDELNDLDDQVKIPPATLFFNIRIALLEIKPALIGIQWYSQKIEEMGRKVSVNGANGVLTKPPPKIKKTTTIQNTTTTIPGQKNTNILIYDYDDIAIGKQSESNSQQHLIGSAEESSSVPLGGVYASSTVPTGDLYGSPTGGVPQKGSSSSLLRGVSESDVECATFNKEQSNSDNGPVNSSNDNGDSILNELLSSSQVRCEKNYNNTDANDANNQLSDPLKKHSYGQSTAPNRLTEVLTVDQVVRPSNSCIVGIHETFERYNISTHERIQELLELLDSFNLVPPRQQDVALGQTLGEQVVLPQGPPPKIKIINKDVSVFAQDNNNTQQQNVSIQQQPINNQQQNASQQEQSYANPIKKEEEPMYDVIL